MEVYNTITGLARYYRRPRVERYAVTENGEPIAWFRYRVDAADFAAVKNKRELRFYNGNRYYAVADQRKRRRK